MEHQDLLFKCNKRKKKTSMIVGGDADLLSLLPDEILESILSRLTLKEAGRTTVLSRRWQYLWEFRTGSMDFDFGKKVMRMFPLRFSVSILEAERDRYTRRVNNIISRHRGSSIQEFRVAFDVRDHSQIDSWIDFALKKRVQRLELQLEPARMAPSGPKNRYGLYRLPVGEGYDMSFLKSLILHRVNLTGEEFEYILSNCKLLEYLALIFSVKLVKSTVVTPCPMLKHLQLDYCFELEELDIYSAPNLTTFVCSHESRFRFRNVPKLSHVSLNGEYSESMVKGFCHLPISPSLLQKLTLSVTTYVVPDFSSFPELKNMKELELIWEIKTDRSLLSYTAVMKACPNLSRLTLEFQWWTDGNEREGPLPSFTEGGIHKNLKDLELVWFRGDAVDADLVIYILCNSPNIEKIKVKTCIPLSLYPRTDIFQIDLITQLAQELSPSAQLLLV